MWVMAAVLAVNVALVRAALQGTEAHARSTPAWRRASASGPGLIHYGLMAVVSVTAVAAFDAVGPVLVVAFFVVPAAAAFLLTDRLEVMIVLACGIGAVGAWLGVIAADRLDANTAGAVATALGVLFALVFLFAPQRGQVAMLAEASRTAAERSRRRCSRSTCISTRGRRPRPTRRACDGLHHHLEWKPDRVANGGGASATENGLVVRAGELLKLTDGGERTGAKHLRANGGDQARVS